VGEPIRRTSFFPDVPSPSAPRLPIKHPYHERALYSRNEGLKRARGVCPATLQSLNCFLDVDFGTHKIVEYFDVGRAEGGRDIEFSPG
jgi:hypothetical protein